MAQSPNELLNTYMKTESSPYFNYDSSESGESLFAVWERGGPAQLPAPLSVRRPRYRQLIVGLITKHVSASRPRVLSIGAGNGFTEAEMRVRGYDVIATDISEIALEYCRRKGLKTLRYEFPHQSFPTPSKFNVIYCDGLLGHLWQLDQSYSRCWSRFAELTATDGLLILSNDLADTDDTPTLKVMGAPEASFFRPPAGWFAKAAEGSGFWHVKETRLVGYLRRGVPRRREILALLFIGERKGRKAQRGGDRER